MIEIIFWFIFKDTPIHSPFESILFIETMKTILRDNRCSITPECHIKGKKKRLVEWVFFYQIHNKRDVYSLEFSDRKVSICYLHRTTMNTYPMICFSEILSYRVAKSIFDYLVTLLNEVILLMFSFLIDLLNAVEWLLCYILEKSARKVNQLMQRKDMSSFDLKNAAQVYHLRTLSIIYIQVKNFY